MTVFNIGGSDSFVYNVKAECKFMQRREGVGSCRRWSVLLAYEMIARSGLGTPGVE